MFEYFNIDLTADDGLKNYGGDRVRIGLITCEEYRILRGNIPALPDRWWWTATPDSPINSFVRSVNSDGSLDGYGACGGGWGVRPLCNLKSEILVSYLNGENAEEQKKRAEACLLYTSPCPILLKTFQAVGNLGGNKKGDAAASSCSVPFLN